MSGVVCLLAPELMAGLQLWPPWVQQDVSANDLHGSMKRRGRSPGFLVKHGSVAGWWGRERRSGEKSNVGTSVQVQGNLTRQQH